MLASPLRAVRTAFKAGTAPRLVPPLRVSESLGPKGSEGGAVGGLEAGGDRDRGWSSASVAKFVPEPKRVLAVEVGLHEVGFKTKSGLTT